MGSVTDRPVRLDLASRSLGAVALERVLRAWARDPDIRPMMAVDVGPRAVQGVRASSLPPHPPVPSPPPPKPKESLP